MPFWSRKAEKTDQDAMELLKLKSEVQSLRLALQECEAERRRQGGEALEAQVVARVEALFLDLGAPIAQLILQGTLIEQGQAVSAQDLWRIVQRLLAVLKSHGLEESEPIGMAVRFDPTLHIPVGPPLRPGERAQVCVPGLRYRGRVIARPGVSASTEGGADGRPVGH